MGWLLSERRGRKQGWMEESLASLSAPPSPLLALLVIVLVLLLFSSYTSYRSQMEKTKVGFHIFLLFLPVMLIFLTHSLIKYGSFPVLSPKTKERVVHQPEGSASPWGVAMFLVLLLVLLCYRSSFQSNWWPHWRSY
ncbi:PREDICTED: transmembrane [Prunus dulcis]|uniref:PREDICTED: transmembrane n=1 Tax=Prunus dulcis TaxID=3755 RepID=A0A5E4F5K1_PRUDU|nr:hypothetical protein L3X38_006600 [Prunus dulcis]VVA22419.1 PREDICTED: transmembrane [Prunus dulcis]